MSPGLRPIDCMQLAVANDHVASAEDNTPAKAEKFQIATKALWLTRNTHDAMRAATSSRVGMASAAPRRSVDTPAYALA